MSAFVKSLCLAEGDKKKQGLFLKLRKGSFGKGFYHTRGKLKLIVKAELGTNYMVLKK